MPTLYRPDHTYRDACILLGLVSGLLLAAVDEAHLRGHDSAVIAFSTMFAADVTLYMNMAWHWFNTRE